MFSVSQEVQESAKYQAFYNKQVEKLKAMDANDSNPNDGRVDIKLFQQAYGRYGWQASSTLVENTNRRSIDQTPNDVGSVNIFEQARLLADQKFGKYYDDQNFDEQLVNPRTANH